MSGPGAPSGGEATLTKTTWVTASVLVVVLGAQFALRRYVPAVYWAAVVLISVVGTQITDNLTDGHGVPLHTTTTIFAVALAVVFVVWWAVERTLSIHTIVTTRREAFYWLTILVTFALGTAAGDYLSETLAIGYWKSALMFAAAIGVVAIAHFRFGLNAVAAFWAAYVLTRPLGATLGDTLTKPHADGGMNLSRITTSLVMAAAMIVLVAVTSLRKRPTAGHGAAAEY